MKKISRRELAGMVAAMTAAQVKPLSSGGASGTAVRLHWSPHRNHRGLDDRRFDPVAFTRDLYAAAPRRLRFDARTRDRPRSGSSSCEQS